MESRPGGGVIHTVVSGNHGYPLPRGTASYIDCSLDIHYTYYTLLYPGSSGSSFSSGCSCVANAVIAVP